jgi:TMEM175 potassium channel family protein
MATDSRPADVLARRHPQHRDEWGVEFARIVAFSDGVFAIAITLLVLAFQIPENSPDVVHSLLNQSGDVFAYALSFAVLGRLWLAHHRFFSVLERFDARLMGLNLLYLAWVVLVPFTSEVLGDYGNDSGGVILYAAVMLGVTLTFGVEIVYAYRAGLVKPELRGVEHRYAGTASFIVAAVFLASIPVALVAPDFAPLMWLVVFFSGYRLARLLGYES